MRYVTQFCIILIVSFLGELLHAVLPIPVPASIYGLILMLTGLISGVIKLSQVSSAGKFLIEIMPMMFIPAAVGLIDYWSALQPILIPVLIITIVTTILVMAVSGRVTQAIIRREGTSEND